MDDREGRKVIEATTMVKGKEYHIKFGHEMDALLALGFVLSKLGIAQSKKWRVLKSIQVISLTFVFD